MKKINLTILVAMMLPGFSLAQGQHNYRCTQGDLVRRVEIFYETGVRVPCEVHYYKDTEAPGERQVLWRALNQEGYCEEKTEEFITKLSGWGWNCTQAVTPEAEAMPESEAMPEGDAMPEAEEADDTETLTPAEESEET